jgi:hypothetical protein
MRRGRSAHDVRDHLLRGLAREAPLRIENQPVGDGLYGNLLKAARA